MNTPFPNDDLSAALRLQLRGLRRDALPQRDLWPDIASQLSTRDRETPPVAEAPRRRALPALAAAAVLVLAAGIGWLQRPGADADAVFRNLDQDGNGSISRAEFDRWWQLRMGPGQVRMPLRTQFDRLDRNRDGSLGQDEYAQMILIRQAGAGAPPLSRFDADRNGRLDYEEYVQLVNQLTRAQTRQAPTPGAPR